MDTIETVSGAKQVIKGLQDLLCHWGPEAMLVGGTLFFARLQDREDLRKKAQKLRDELRDIENKLEKKLHVGHGLDV